MIAVILAAGVSSRLRPLTDAIPKALLPVGGIPIIQRTLRSLGRSGITRIVIVTGYRKEPLETFIASLRSPIEILRIFNPEFARTGNNYSLWLALRAVGDESIVLFDSDVLFRPSTLADLLNTPHENALIMRRTAQLGSEEVKVELAGGDRILRIGKDIDPLRAAGESIGIERFSPQAARALLTALDGRKGRNEFYEAAFQEIIDGGIPVHAVPAAEEDCVEIDTPADVRKAEALAARFER